MRAITYRQNGDPDVLTLVDKAPSEPGPGEVRVRIHRSGVNPTDWKSRRGTQAGGLPLPRPRRRVDLAHDLEPGEVALAGGAGDRGEGGENAGEGAHETGILAAPPRPPSRRSRAR